MGFVGVRLQPVTGCLYRFLPDDKDTSVGSEENRKSNPTLIDDRHDWLIITIEKKPVKGQSKDEDNMERINGKKLKKKSSNNHNNDNKERLLFIN